MAVIISRDKNLLYPPFVKQLKYFESRLAAARLPFYLFMAFRAFECQDELYAQGRTKSGQIVTNARGGDSLHNYGLASDFVLDGQVEKPGIQWSRDTKADFDADGCGLEWGGRWKRMPDLPMYKTPMALPWLKSRRSIGPATA